MNSPGYPLARKILTHLTERLSGLMGKIMESIRLLPLLVKKPSVVRQWLFGARAAQIALLVTLVLVPSILPKAMDVVLEKVFPPVSEERLFGLLQSESDDPRLENYKQIARIALWTSSLGLVAVLLILHIQVSINIAEARSIEHEDRADELGGGNPTERISLYRSAFDLTVNEIRMRSLAEKLNSLKTTPIQPSFDLVMPSRSDARSTARTVVQNKPEQALAHVGPGGRYRVKNMLGRGAMGVVFRAHDTVLERDVALKELLANLAHDEELVKRFRQEARVLAQFKHPNIVQVYDFLEDAGRIWIVIEFVEGGELSELLKARSPLTASEVVRLGIPMAEAMAYAHDRGVIHRDFKPSNVLLTADGSPKITDFGIAKLAESNHYTHTGAVLGSPAYMSPEQANGKTADNRSDIYALGVVFYRMLTGKAPFVGDDMASVLVQHIHKQPEPPHVLNPEIPPGLEELVLSMLMKDPDTRIQDMATVSKALRKTLVG